MVSVIAQSTALVLIDLQQGIVAPARFPYSSEQVLTRCQRLAARCREAGATVVLVNVGWATDHSDYPNGLADAPSPLPSAEKMESWMTLCNGIAENGDLHITKHQWGAFTGTELDLQLRRRGVDTIIVAGIATNFGVESTLRHGWELGYNMVVAEDACTSADTTLHNMAFEYIFPRIARVTQTDEITLTKR